MSNVVTMFANTSEAYQQQVVGDFQYTREYEAIGWNTFRNNLDKRKAGEKGLKLLYDNIIQGGHSTPTALRPDWNEPTVNEQLAAYVYPVRYRLPMIFDHGTLRDYKNRNQIGADALKRTVLGAEIAALKRLNRAFYGVGDGALAFSTSAITAIGSSTMNCDTTPSTSPGHTKGAKWLEKNQWYQAINVSTGLPRGLFQVTAPGSTSCTVNLVSGAISSGDPIVNVNTYNGFFRGLGWLISETNRTIQGINTADNPDFNSYGIDLAGAPLTFAAFEDLRVGLQIRNNNGKKAGLVFFLPPGQSSVLRKSAQNLRMYNSGDNVAKGIMEDVDFGSNTNAVVDADMDEDRVYAAVYPEFGMLEEMPLDVMDMDGNEWHQLMGANNSGSDRYQRGIGWDGNFFRKGNAMSSAYIFRGSTTGVLTQATI
jgi:hypothetical protein